MVNNIVKRSTVTNRNIRGYPSLISNSSVVISLSGCTEIADYEINGGNVTEHKFGQNSFAVSPMQPRF